MPEGSAAANPAFDVTPARLGDRPHHRARGGAGVRARVAPALPRGWTGRATPTFSGAIATLPVRPGAAFHPMRKPRPPRILENLPCRHCHGRPGRCRPPPRPPRRRPRWPAVTTSSCAPTACKAGASHALLDSYLEKALIPAAQRPGHRGRRRLHRARGKGRRRRVGAVSRTLAGDRSRASPPRSTRIPRCWRPGSDYLTSPTKAQPGVRPHRQLAHPGLPGNARGWRCRSWPARESPGFSRCAPTRASASSRRSRRSPCSTPGEIGVMQEVDLSPVFYGQALLGRDLPHLTYMLCSADMATHKKNWDGVPGPSGLDQAEERPAVRRHGPEDHEPLPRAGGVFADLISGGRVSGGIRVGFTPWRAGVALPILAGKPRIHPNRNEGHPCPW